MRGGFRVGLTRDFLRTDGTIGWGDIGLGMLDEAPGVEWEFLPEGGGELGAGQVSGYDALIVLGPRVTTATVEGAERLALVARFGVGYDNVDLAACTRGGVAVTITPEGVRRPVAAANMALILALAHRLPAKDRIARSGRWEERLDHMGTGLTGRTLGSVGLGNIGREMFALAAPFGMRHLAHDPYAAPEKAAEAGAELVDLETLLRRSDFVAINCALTPETHHLLDAERLALMKETAYLVNVARGPIVDGEALTGALREGRLAGAGLDVFEKEPADPEDPIFSFPGVIAAPHALAWTDELALGNGRAACEGVLDVAAGRAPKNVVNGDVLGTPRFRNKLARYGEGPQR
ncbi:MAG: D-3-phosphoglycerate dehydrogenase [uncultured Rubrobacteraceae bacterium]|uniref:D-3-phosphoglycerate dehydrogenase n=1 Tax=uncultured Rubrobacteraceae bacterium TaxID=349277 RepID=A0A6J4RYM8_9ACTN|nr:MAG: D-3-phosphoglycerate dehydrogenase [uncultured Rubrobacteraceae bacterium]